MGTPGSPIPANVSTATRVTGATAAMVILALLLLFFTALMMFSARPLLSDDGVHLYSAHLLARGRLPYRDFFHAHPPLHLAPLAVLARCFGSGAFAALKAWTFLAAEVQLVCLWWISCRALGPELGRIRFFAPLVPIAALVFSCTFLRTASTNTGIVEATAYLSIAAVCLSHRRWVPAGVMAGAATMTMLQAVPLVPCLVIFAAAAGSRALGRFALGLASVLAMVNLVGLAVAGEDFLQQVYLGHLHKVPKPAESTRLSSILIASEIPLIGLALAATAAVAVDRRLRRISVVMVAGVAMLALAIASRPRVFPHYFHPFFLPLGILIALGVGALARTLAEGRVVLVRSRWIQAATAIALSGCVFALVRTAARSFPAAAAPRGPIDRYRWTPARLPAPVDGLVRTLFWQGGLRQDARPRNGITEYLWTRSLWLSSHAEMVEEVRRRAGTTAALNLFGDVTAAPLVALEAGVPILDDLVDMNPQWFEAGVRADSDVIRALDASPQTVLLVADQGIGRRPALRQYLQQRYRVARRFDSHARTTHRLLERLPSP
jgi:hypothetical protein